MQPCGFKAHGCWEIWLHVRETPCWFQIGVPVCSGLIVSVAKGNREFVAVLWWNKGKMYLSVWRSRTAFGVSVWATLCSG